MRFVVCGSTGFIGRALCEKLKKDNHDILGISRGKGFDITKCSFRTLSNAISNFSPEVLIHLASYPIVKNYNFKAGLDTLVAHKLLDMTPINCKFVFASSIAVYGEDSREVFRAGSELNPLSVYAQTKAHNERLIELYSKTYKRIKDYSILRFCGHIGDDKKGVIHDIIKKLQSPEKTLKLFGNSPGSSKPYIYIDDSVNAIIKLSMNSFEQKIFNICSDDTLSVLEIANIIMDKINIRKGIEWLGDEQNWQGDAKVLKVKGDIIELSAKDALIKYMDKYGN